MRKTPKKQRSIRQPVLFSRPAANWAIGIGLFLLAVGLFSRSLSSGLVYDARMQILTDTFIHDRSHFWDVLTFKVMSEDVLDNNRPVHLLSMMIDSLFWGKNPFGYHLTSVLLHGACTVLVFVVTSDLLRRSGRAPGLAAAGGALGAAIFAVHPINCEPVAEPSYREDLLTTFFILIGLLLAQKFQPVRSWRNYLLGGFSALAMLLATGAKENGAAGPITLGFYWLLFRRKESRVAWSSLVGSSVLLVGAFLAVRFTLPPKESLIFPGRASYLGGSFWAMTQIQPRIWVFELKHLVWFRDLSADYAPWADYVRDISLTKAWVILVLLGLIVGLFAWRSRVVFMGAAVFVLGMVPVSNLLPMYQLIADRFFYLPMVGVAMAAGAGLSWPGWWKRPWIGRSAGFASFVLLVVLAVVTVEREQVWHDSLTLWQRTLQTNPRSVVAADDLGWAYYDAGTYEKSLESFELALDLTQGTCADAWAGASLALEATGQPDQADRAFRSAVEHNSKFADPDSVLASLRIEPVQAEKLRPIALRYKQAAR